MKVKVKANSKPQTDQSFEGIEDPEAVDVIWRNLVGKIVKASATERKEAARYELQTKDLGDGSFATILVPAEADTPDHFCVSISPEELKSFPGHKGIPGHQGGSLPKQFITDRLQHTIQIIDGVRMFVESKYRPDKMDWLKKAIPNEIYVQSTIDLPTHGKTTYAYLNRMDATQGEGYGTETMKGIFDILYKMGITTARGYIENNNLASKGAAQKLGGRIISSTDFGDIWEFDMTPKTITVKKSFPGHKGRPGQQGGSLPRQGDASVADVRIPYESVDYRAFHLLGHKGTSKLLGKYNITVDTAKDLPDNLYNAIRDYIGRSVDSSVGMTDTKMRRHLGETLAYELDQFAGANDFGSPAKPVNVDGINFGSDMTAQQQNFVIDALKESNVNVKNISYNIASITFTPPDGYEQDPGYPAWSNAIGQSIKGMCQAATTMKANIHVYPDKGSDSMKKTLVHELGHVVHLYTNHDYSAFKAKVDEAFDNLNVAAFRNGRKHLFTSMGLRDYSFTNSREMFADMYMTVKTTGESSAYSQGIKAFVSDTVWQQILNN